MRNEATLCRLAGELSIAKVLYIERTFGRGKGYLKAVLQRKPFYYCTELLGYRVGTAV